MPERDAQESAEAVAAAVVAAAEAAEVEGTFQEAVDFAVTSAADSLAPSLQPALTAAVQAALRPASQPVAHGPVTSVTASAVPTPALRLEIEKLQLELAAARSEPKRFALKRRMQALSGVLRRREREEEEAAAIRREVQLRQANYARMRRKTGAPPTPTSVYAASNGGANAEGSHRRSGSPPEVCRLSLAPYLQLTGEDCPTSPPPLGRGSPPPEPAMGAPVPAAQRAAPEGRQRRRRWSEEDVDLDDIDDKPTQVAVEAEIEAEIEAEAEAKVEVEPGVQPPAEPLTQGRSGTSQ